MDQASAFSSCVIWKCVCRSARERYGWCRMSCEFISEMRVNSHSPILEMSLNDVSVRGYVRWKLFLALGSGE